MYSFFKYKFIYFNWRLIKYCIVIYVYKKEGIVLGVLTQRLGPKPQPVAYLSKRLDLTT